MKPAAEVAIDDAVIRALLHEQHRDLAALTLTDLGEGWDNRLVRLGDDLIVRAPRRALAAPLIEHEQRWLPQLSPRLPLPIPVPVRVGRPGCGYPWSWSITAWYPGQSALTAPPRDLAAAAAELGMFLRALHQPAPSQAPANPWRGIELAARTPVCQAHVRQLDRAIDRDAVLDLWQRACAAPPWTEPPLWVHGDLHPGNVLMQGNHVSAVVDFGDLAAGDPATDLAVAWLLLPRSLRPAFLAAARGDADPIDASTVLRARGWAVALGLALAAGADDDERMRTLGIRAIAEAVADDATW